ncbi:putative transporter [Glaesserella parasuis]|uniref:Putative transport protein HAPS_0158 n=2 Tax=Glaesserella parasuis TaxID=738 RepID=Y158_GLAP5|nr:putative transporter [Glaesserella parasuis]B8F3F2.1 RecName: Full=Putative transport protein HAPS_0158 [Glaesserella parasuis SH0165]ACL31854.1 AAE family aspartate/alanine transporter [Glaesserella parasuis SH0165]AIK17238.1 transporter [Glaesserella parasuis]ATW45761.1 transporter [Glaesserella parasuis str. Nagasaki]EQA04109.1 AspT/YidE/YbjL antiporter duplication domain protein [Glaesserella parasuis str. Nagasaki]EYE71709.1 putative transporter [Glaesserella parasuis str. Nagasaki]
MSEIALTVSLLSLVAVIGLWIGHIKVRGVSLGIGGVLFGGILVSHFMTQYGVKLDGHTLHFIQEFGLILFVYTIGIQVGPGFFASLRQSGLKLNAFAVMIVGISGILVILLHKIFDVPLPVILGIFSGAVTNTPSLGAGQQILTELGGESITAVMGMGYAIAYPFGIIGILLAMWLIRIIFKINVDKEADEFDSATNNKKDGLSTMNVRITNPNLNGLMLQEFPDFELHEVVYSRIKRNDELFVPKVHTQIQIGDILHLVGTKTALHKMQLILGEEVNVSLSTKGTMYRTERAVVTNEKVFGKQIRQLMLKGKYDVVISRLNRAGVELVPNGQMTLQFGDVLNLVGRQEDIEAVMAIIGNAQQKLQQVQMLPIFIGVGLGVLLGSIPIYLPGFPVALKLGLAGGPLVVALILARIGSIKKLYWFMPPSANLALREIGIVLFLAVVGWKAGGNFLNTLLSNDGLAWIGYGAIITFVPLIVTGLVARIYGKLNYLSLCGLLAGSMTDPPALAFANGIKEGNGAAALSYATVYPLVMFCRIILPQILAILLWVAG